MSDKWRAALKVWLPSLVTQLPSRFFKLATLVTVFMNTEMTSRTPNTGKGDPTVSAANIYDDGRLRVEHENYYVACDGQALQLPRKEFLILSRLARNAERIVASEEIWRHSWPGDARFNPESLHVHIYRLRRRLEPFGLHIETMVNVGYRLVT